MSRNGGRIGGVNIPTTSVASGAWGMRQVAQQVGGFGAGLFWPNNTIADSNFSSVSLLAHFDTMLEGSGLTKHLDSSSNANHMGITAAAANVPAASGLSAIGTGKFARAWLNGGPPGDGFGLKVMTTAGTSLTLGTGDFTLEAWISIASTAGTQVFFDMRGGSNTNPIFYMASNVLTFDPRSIGAQRSGTTAITISTWHHIHCTRASGVVYMGLDGAQESTDYTDSTNCAGNTAYVGCAFNSTVPMDGKMSEVRITKGVARYARTYTVPIAPFPDH